MGCGVWVLLQLCVRKKNFSFFFFFDYILHDAETANVVLLHIRSSSFTGE